MEDKTKSLIWEWQKAKDAMKEAQLREDALRSAVIMSVFGDNMAEGTTSAEIAPGFVLRAKCSYTRAIDEDAVQCVMERITGDAKKVFRVKHSLDKKAYDALTENDRKIVDEAVTTKPGKPQLEVVEKKEK